MLDEELEDDIENKYPEQKEIFAKLLTHSNWKIRCQVAHHMLEVMNSDYIRTARAKGLKEKVVINKHAFRNTLIPMVTSLAGLLPSLFSGAIITEQVFDLPGIGNIALDAMNRGDIPFIMGYNMFLALLSVIGVLLADLMYGLVDPRVKLE